MTRIEYFNENVKIKYVSLTNFPNLISNQGGGSNTPPHSHTDHAPSSPLSGFAASFDFLRGKGNTNDINAVIRHISTIFSCTLEPQEDTYKDPHDTYTHSAFSGHGIKINFAPYDLDQNPDFRGFGDSPKSKSPEFWKFFLSISGSPLRTISVCNQVRFFKYLRDNTNFRATRIDIALDDYRRTCTFKRLKAAIQKGNLTKFRTTTIYEGDYTFKDGQVHRGLPSIYFGSKNSTRRLIFYDALVHDYDADRFEYRLKEKEAAEYFNYFTDSSCIIWDCDQDFEKLLGSMLAGTIVGSIDFINKKSRNLNRCPRLRFWKKFCDTLGTSLIFSVIREDTTIQKKVKWILKSWRNTLQGFRAGFCDQQFFQFFNVLSDPDLSEPKVLALVELILNEKKDLNGILSQVRQCSEAPQSWGVGGSIT